MSHTQFGQKSVQCAQEYTHKINIKRNTLDEDTTNLLTIIQNFINANLTRFNCLCLILGEGCQIFGFILKWWCKNCTRPRQIMKYRDYLNNYQSALNCLRTNNPQQALERFLGAAIIRPFDVRKLIDIFRMIVKYISELLEIVSQERGSRNRDFRNFRMVEETREIRVTNSQLQSQRIAEQNSNLIRLNKLGLNVDTLRLHHNIQHRIQTELRRYDCCCRPIGQNLAVFEKLYNWQCKTCHGRKERIVKYQKYMEQYDYAIRRLDSETPRIQIQQFIGAQIDRPFDVQRLLQLMRLQREFIQSLWDIQHMQERKQNRNYRTRGILGTETTRIIHRQNWRRPRQNERNEPH